MKILVCGDFTTNARGLNAVFNGTAISSSVINIIDRHDYTIVNLETPVVNNDSPRIAKYGPSLKTSLETITYLKECGFGNVTLANNHFYDYGETGVLETINCLHINNIKYVGGGVGDEKREPLYIQGKANVCILNYCESEFSVDHEMGSNKLDPIQVYYDINKAKENGYSVLIIVHGGHEGFPYPSPRMKQLYRFFIDCGANVVINHHQHCYSGYECYNEGMIFYGLGNFFFDKVSQNVGNEWFEGYMVGLNIENNRLVDYNLYPYSQCKDDIIDVHLMKGEERTAFYTNIEEINKVISNDELLIKRFYDFANSKREEYMLRFTPYTSRVLMGLYRRKLLPSFINNKIKIRILNAIKCESHRDVCMCLLNND